LSYKAHFQRFLNADPARLHFAAHSHHLWPDVTFAAQERCWLDAARLADRKWAHVFGEVIPSVQRGVARLLNLSHPEDIAFAPNTHGLLNRLLSCLPRDRPLRVLTTDGEFHSLTRQLRRLEEDGLARVDWLAVAPFDDFAERFAGAAARGGHDLVYLSQVFFNSGFALDDLVAMVAAVPESETFVVIDGYHGFLALPTDLRPIEARAFYLAGGYKYAMAGEGAAFLHAPPGAGARPRDTGWYAAFGALERGEGARVGYGTDGSRFLGATFDPSGLYRLDAVLAWLAELGLDAADIHGHALGLQESFITGLAGCNLAALHPGQLLLPEPARRGNFLTFRTPAAGEIYEKLMARNVITDRRADSLRFGFGLYQDEDDVARLCEVLGEVLD
jgi:selenocysteine lyase/cysteine desulfurase